MFLGMALPCLSMAVFQDGIPVGFDKSHLRWDPTLVRMSRKMFFSNGLCYQQITNWHQEIHISNRYARHSFLEKKPQQVAVFAYMK
jgi:hypothetical protein